MLNLALRRAVRKASGALRAPNSFALTEALFLRLLGLIYLSAFASLWPQIVGLLGSRGISPAHRLLEAAHAEFGSHAFLYLPTLFWLYLSNSALLGICIAGCIASVLLVLALFSRWAALACFVFYLSLVSVGQPFLSFQWDALLLEAGFLAIFSGAPWLVWAYRFLLFRLMFESGWVKLASHDPNWQNFHALRFHFVTQPLPTPLAYYAYRSPAPLLDGLTVATLLIELIAPLLLFFPRVARYIGVGLLAALQVIILLTGNYAFFNLLSLALCLWGLDDQFFLPLSRLLSWRFPRTPISSRLPWFRVMSNVALTIMILLGAIQLLELVDRNTPAFLFRPLAIVQPFEIINSYGLFAVMTITRPEIIIEGSDDQSNWLEFNFPYKPGNTHRGLPWIAPYQPRLDWQMWFAALGSYQENNWIGGLMYRLLTNEPSVARLLNPSPFPKPPRYMRALLYDYQFTTPADRTKSGAVWQRKLQGTWFGPVSLNGQ